MSPSSSSSSPSSSSTGLSFSLKTTLCTLTALRLCLSFTNIQAILQHDHLLSSPLTSYLRLKEGLFLFSQGIDPYDGGLFRHSPLHLSLFSTLIPNSQIASSIPWSLLDALGAWSLVQIWRSRQGGVQSSSRDSLVAASYLLNPYTLLPSLALSTSTLSNTLVLLTLSLASKRLRSPTLLSLAFVVHLSIPSLLLILPVMLLLLCPTGPVSQLASPHRLDVNLRDLGRLLGEFGAYFAVLTLAASIVAGGVHWIPQTWGTSFMLPDLTPNTGLWWYFFTEMFDHFRPFFLMVFSVHLIIYIAPICIKFQYDPLYATFLLLGILGTFKAYPTLSDPGLFISLISIFPETYPYLRYPIVSAFLHLHASLLLPLFNHLWLAQGSGNANFFYASTLVFACANGAVVMDCVWAGLRIALGPGPETQVDVGEEGVGEKGVGEGGEGEWAITQE